MRLSEDRNEAMRMMSDIENITANLPGIGLRLLRRSHLPLFAEDVVKKETEIDECTVIMRELFHQCLSMRQANELTKKFIANKKAHINKWRMKTMKLDHFCFFSFAFLRRRRYAVRFQRSVYAGIFEPRDEPRRGGQSLITIMTNVTVIAVASPTDAKAVMLAENVELAPPTPKPPQKKRG